MFYAALDVSLRSVAICIIDQDGKLRLERSVASEVPDLIRCLREFGEPIHQVGLEAGTLTQHLTYGLTEAGYDVVCMEARQVNAALSAMRNKTDKHDARGIAQILRSGWYSRVHVKSVESHHARALLTSRKVIQRKCVDLENEIRGLLKVFGVKLPIRLSRGAFDNAVRDTIEGDAALSYALLPMLQARQMLFETFVELDRRVSARPERTQSARASWGIPGVGEITVLSFKAAVDDPARFWSSRTVGAHFGLTPRRFQSGETDNPGRISHAGDADVRATLYAAANAMLMRSITWSSLRAWGVRLMKTKGRRRAIVAVARKIAVVLHRMWVDGSAWSLWYTNDYDSWRNRKTPALSLNYSVRSYQSLPPLPASLPEPLKLRAEPAIRSANEMLRGSGEVFKDLATYINAKDYEDDKFKKGDELNAKLIAAGKSCHQLDAELTEIYRDLAVQVIDRRKAVAPHPEIVATVIADWQKARALSRELARFAAADRATLEGLVRDMSALSEERKVSFEPLKQAPQAMIKRFYEAILQDDMAVKMRRLLREAKTPKAFKEAAEDRPRSEFWSVRRGIDYAMPDAILAYLRNPD